MHEVRAEPLDHSTRSAGIETGEVCQRTSHSPRLRVCSTWYGWQRYCCPIRIAPSPGEASAEAVPGGGGPLFRPIRRGLEGGGGGHQMVGRLNWMSPP